MSNENKYCFKSLFKFADVVPEQEGKPFSGIPYRQEYVLVIKSMFIR